MVLLKNMKPINLHASSINGKGKGMTLMFRTLLPLIIEKIDRDNSFFFCSKDIESDIKEYLKSTNYKFFKPKIPNYLYRTLECTFFPPKMNHNNPLLTFGDVPLRYKGKQILFLANAHLVENNISIKNYKFIIMRYLFKINLKFVDKIIVQTKFMRDSLIKHYKVEKKRIVIINSPPPNLILNNRKRFKKNLRKGSAKLSLFYPATFYPHKNHKILSRLNNDAYNKIEHIYLTIPKRNNPNIYKQIIKCLDNISPEDVLKFYGKADALLFLSAKESYGFPLIEAMLLNMYIICPNLEYARELCGNEAIYFEYDCETSLSIAIDQLDKKLKNNDLPNWSYQLSKININWENTANKFLRELH